MNRIKSALNLYPKINVLYLAIFSLITTWLFTYRRVYEYLIENGASVEQVSHFKVLTTTFDLTVIIFSILVLVAAGLVPVISTIIKPSASMAKASQVLWALLIIGFIWLAKSTS